MLTASSPEQLLTAGYSTITKIALQSHVWLHNMDFSVFMSTVSAHVWPLSPIYEKNPFFYLMWMILMCHLSPCLLASRSRL